MVNWSRIVSETSSFVAPVSHTTYLFCPNWHHHCPQMSDNRPSGRGGVGPLVLGHAPIQQLLLSTPCDMQYYSSEHI